ncbi:MAG: adenosine kinase [Bacillota bacterium]
MEEKVGGNLEVYGIGNPLIDVLAQASDEEIEEMQLNKGIMTLIDTERGNYILGQIKDREKIYSCGGSAPNTMITLAALGVRSALAGTVGNDELGDIYYNRLIEKNVTSDLVSIAGDTGSCIVLVTPDYERTMNTRLGVAQNYGPENVNHANIAEANYLYFTGYMWNTEFQKKALQEAIKTAHQNETKVVFDLADPFVVEANQEDFHKLLESGKIDVLLANRDEARLLLGIDDPEKASRQLADKGVIATVKNCADGSCISPGEGKCINVDAYKVEAVDSTGAGDNYAAGFLYGLINGYSLPDAGKLASFIAAQVVCQTGAQFDDQSIIKIKKAIEEGLWR